jgi:hypothetical protein
MLVANAAATAGASAVETTIQLGAEHSEAEAAAKWVDILHRNEDLLTNVRPSIAPVRVPHKGTLYRLRAGPFDSAGASAVCTELKARQVACIVVH